MSDGAREHGDAGPALVVERLTFAYGTEPALDAVSFSVARGRFAALVGANGAGKSTLFAILSGLFSTGHGRVSILGADLATRPRAALSALGVVFQQPTLDPDLSVRQNLAYFADLHGLARGDARSRIDSTLDRHALADVADRRVSTLSGGQRRRVELARALLHRPGLLLLDEPTVGLDMASRAAFLAHVRELVDTLGIAVLWATHLADEIAPDDPVHLLERGRLLTSAPLEDAFAEHGVASIGALTDALRPTAESAERVA